MDATTQHLLILAVTLAVVTLNAWRMGNEKRDVALLATSSGLCGVGAIVAAAL